jgi:hypothetical protein
MSHWREVQWRALSSELSKQPLLPTPNLVCTMCRYDESVPSNGEDIGFEESDPYTSKPYCRYCGSFKWLEVVVE